MAALSPAQKALWGRAAKQIGALRDAELNFAAKVRDDLVRYPGYFYAAVRRTEELLSEFQERPTWIWAMERWAAVFREGGLPETLALLEDPLAHQELLSASPFTVMRPPLLENDFYRAYEPA